VLTLVGRERVFLILFSNRRQPVNNTDIQSYTVGSRFTTIHFYDPLSSRTEHSRLVVLHCRNSSVLSLLSALLALFRCACVSSFSILVQFFKLIVIFPPMKSIKKTEKKKKSKQLTLHSFLMWLRCCGTNRRVAGSVPDDVIGIFR